MFLPRITVLSYQAIVDKTLANLGIQSNKEADYQWIKKNVLVEDICSFEESEGNTLVNFFDGSSLIVFDAFEVFEQKINQAESTIDAPTMAEEIASHLAIIFSPEPSEGE